jgi:hypothetical protein
VIFIPIGFLMFKNQPTYCEEERICHVFSGFSWTECMGNFTGVLSTYNYEWWFLRSYIIALVSFPVVRGIIEKCTARINLLIIILASIMVTDVLPALGNMESLGLLNNNYLYSQLICQTAPYIACFWMGVVVAKEKLLRRLEKDLVKNKLLTPMSDILIWVFVIYFRQIGIGEVLDIFYVPVLCVASIDFIHHFEMVKRILISVRKESTNMWLIHSFYCYYFYFFVKIVVAPRWALASLSVLILLSYVSSVGVSCFWKSISKGLNRVRTANRKM